MKQTLITIATTLIVVLMCLGCSSTNQLATETIYDAKVQVETAKAANAQELAPQELGDAEQLLARSEEGLSAGKETEAYRLGMRAHLKAKIAEALALASQLEAEAISAEEALELKLDDAAAAYQDLKGAEQELKELQSTPEDVR